MQIIKWSQLCISKDTKEDVELLVLSSLLGNMGGMYLSPSTMLLVVTKFLEVARAISRVKHLIAASRLHGTFLPCLCNHANHEAIIWLGLH